MLEMPDKEIGSHIPYPEIGKRQNIAPSFDLGKFYLITEGLLCLFCVLLKDERQTKISMQNYGVGIKHKNLSV